jgi:tetratricopeptide (TPR) repeat protein
LLAAEFPSVPAIREEMAICGFNLANVFRRTGRTEQCAATLREAIVVLQRVAEESPRQSDLWRRLAQYHYVLGLILTQAGRADDAWDAFAQALTIRNRLITEFPQVARYWEELAWQLATCPDVKSRDAPRAVTLAQKAVELSPQIGTSWKVLGVAQYRVGDFDAALESLRTATSLSSRNRSEQWFLAMTYWRQGKLDQARECLSQAAAWMDNNLPDDPDLRRFRSEAEELLGMNRESR